jgi:hypothetical protein
MTNGGPTSPDPSPISSEVAERLESVAKRIGAMEGIVGETKTEVGRVKEAIEKLGKRSNWLPFWAGLLSAIIAATGSFIASKNSAQATLDAAQKSFDATLAAAQRSFETSLATAQKNLENASKTAFENARGTSSLQDYKTGQELIVKIKNEFAESAVQRSVKAELGIDLHALKLLADRLKVPELLELSDYAGRLRGAYWRKEKRWEDYEQQEKENIEQRCDKASEALNNWAQNPG